MFDHIVSEISGGIDKLLESREPVLIAIDGRCGSGKSSLGKILERKYGATLLHMDDFFLRPQQRTIERLKIPGENIDHERFQEEVLTKVVRGEVFQYIPFSCETQQLCAPMEIFPKKLVIIEGTYSCHQRLRDSYDMRIFLSVDNETQISRIIKRNGEECAEIFRKRWIPLEESYFSVCKVAECCHMYFET